jgi:adenylate cyclase class IV
MADTDWKKEIEKKYRLPGTDACLAIERVAKKVGFTRLYEVTQRDWMPDFADWRLKHAHILLRIRYLSYKTGTGPMWLITLRRRSKGKDTHHNSELEASSEEPDRLPVLERTLREVCGMNIDLARLLNNDRSYIENINLTTHRMLLEKKRCEYISPDGRIYLALDELPRPLGYFVELESHESTAALKAWEEELSLARYQTINEDYGQLVKTLQPDGNCRTLVFNPKELA